MYREREVKKVEQMTLQLNVKKESRHLLVIYYQTQIAEKLASSTFLKCIISELCVRDKLSFLSIDVIQHQHQRP